MPLEDLHSRQGAMDSGPLRMARLFGKAEIFHFCSTSMLIEHDPHNAREELPQIRRSNCPGVCRTLGRGQKDDLFSPLAQRLRESHVPVSNRIRRSPVQDGRTYRIVRSYTRTEACHPHRLPKCSATRAHGYCRIPFARSRFRDWDGSNAAPNALPHWRQFLASERLPATVTRPGLLRCFN